MKHYLPNQNAAQTAADQAHAYLIANDAAYADSVAKGHTTCWCNPAEDEGGWYILVEPRLYPCFGIEVPE